MLSEIYCEKFHQKKIIFNDGLSIILGTKSGDNSIGKSTFLLIVDYVFGGSTYSKETDILDNIGSHNICFKFIFNKKEYYFLRSNTENSVWICDSNYKKIKSKSKDDYCKWLSEQYNLNYHDLKFRDAVGRYIRTYGKNNCDEKHPLNVYPSEPQSKAVIAILKLFDLYHAIANLEQLAKDSSDAFSTFQKAQALNFISKINKEQYKTNLKQIDIIKGELDELSNKLEKGLLDIDAATSEEAISIKKYLSSARRMKNTIDAKLSTINENLDYKFNDTTDTYWELKKFFPDVNIRHISEVEAFHKKISDIFIKELKEARKELTRQAKDCAQIIENYEEELKNLIQNPNLPRTVLKINADKQREIDRMTKENEAFEKSEILKQQKKENQDKLKEAKAEKLGLLEKSINHEMERINKLLYTEKYNAPLLHFSESSYVFSTPNDTGTGIAYKGLIVFDLAVMHLTKLPILVHDSVVLKQISDNAIEKIMEQYLACNKQIIIAFDKQDSYSERTNKLLEKYAVLNLAPNGQELFGWSWGKQIN